MGRVGGIGCLVPHSGPNLALFESCGAMDGESCVGKDPDLGPDLVGLVWSILFSINPHNNNNNNNVRTDHTII